VGHRAGQDNREKFKFLTLSGLDLRPLIGRPARSHSLYHMYTGLLKLFQFHKSITGQQRIGFFFHIDNIILQRYKLHSGGGGGFAKHTNLCLDLQPTNLYTLTGNTSSGVHITLTSHAYKKVAMPWNLTIMYNKFHAFSQQATKGTPLVDEVSANFCG
jgi:hypothetical protein